ncbi:MAG: glycosyltransferase [Candidatus Helarchaeales archaeon]
MKIGFFTDTYSQINGVTVTIKALEKELRRKGHEVYIYAPRGEAGETKNNPYLFTSEAIRFFPSPEYKWAVFPVFTIPKSNLGLDIVHVHSPISMGLAGLINARRLGIPCIGTIHTVIPEFWKPFIKKLLPYFTPPVVDLIIDRFLKPVVDTTIGMGSRLMKELSWRYYVEFFRRCDETLVPSRYTQQLCWQQGLMTTVLPNGVDFSSFHVVQDLEPFERHWNVNKDDFLVICVGRLSEEKNLELVLEAAGKVLQISDKIRFMIVGDGPLRTKLERLVKKLGIASSIIFTGYLDRASLNEVYSRANAYINASPIETQGLSIIEAMFFGIPILSINCGAAMDLFEAPIGLMFKNDPKDLARALMELVNNPSLRKKSGRRARLEAKKYDISKFCDKLLTIYNEYI